MFDLANPPAKANQSGVKVQQNGQNVNSQTQEEKTLANLIRRQIGTLFTGPRAESIVKNLVAVVEKNDALKKCSIRDLVVAALQSDVLHLSINPLLGQAWLIPYSGKVQFQIGYKGYILIARRSHSYRRINVANVKEGEFISWDPFREEFRAIVDSRNPNRDILPTIGYYGVLECLDGFIKEVYWSKEQMTRHAQRYVKSYNSPGSFWRKDFDIMAQKTLLYRMLSKYGENSPDFQTAQHIEIAENNGEHYVQHPEVAKLDNVTVDGTKIEEVEAEMDSAQEPVKPEAEQSPLMPADPESGNA